MFDKLYLKKSAVQHNAGFIALISAIIITVVLLTLVVSVSFTGFFGRFDILGSETKEISQGLAEACIETAIIKHAQDNTYAGNNDPIPVGENECTIVSITPVGSGNILIRAQGKFPKDGLLPAFTNLEVELNPSNDYSVVFWTEVP